MKTFHCHCGNRLYFENTVCVHCGREVGYLPEHRRIVTLQHEADDLWSPATTGGSGGRYRKCRNYEPEQVCNWMIPADDHDAFCHACRLNRTIPDLGVPENRRFWLRVERAKRRLVYTLDALGLPVFGKSVDGDAGLAFEFLRDAAPLADEFSNPAGDQHRILTGHRHGIITINIEEADPGARERMRENLNEGYRTLLGHFRHEIAHYYWDLLVRDTAWLAPFRTLFGDERTDYDEALAGYYRDGPPEKWPARHISAYAAAHPWEDWAETWAHYLHMVDTLETAEDLNLSVRGRAIGGMPADPTTWLQESLTDWHELTVALNDLNRSMGLPDAYPFAISATVAEKLALVREIIATAPRADPTLPPTRNGAVPTGPA
ncbi:MAG: putative zinc-binding peptidase [Rhodospirillales bacterium]|nr:MAG: putative zinc-binding peptidase [Rhodospirillales bacterium]